MHLLFKILLILFVFHFNDLISQELDSLQEDLKELEELLKVLPRPRNGTAIDSQKISYLKRIEDNIKNSISQRLSKKYSKFKFHLVLNREGLITKLKIIQSSGSKKIDGKLLKAINNSQPFEKLPDTHLSDSMVIMFTIIGSKK